VVLDPGHSPTIQSVDPGSGLTDSDYENEPEMRDVFAVAELVKQRLEVDGYRVVLTKTTATDRVSLGQRAAIANQVRAAIAVSIHDQAGSNGGIAFNQGNNIVYYQSVGGYRETANGRKVVFTRSAVAATSKRFGSIFQAQRSAAEGHPITLQANVGYNLGSRGLAAGDMWMVQLLAQVPWIYNEAGGNSAGQSGLDAADEQKYARGLVDSIEHCVPVARA
jgi:N-acetylmuramoyl-L-alanine amidase